MRVNAQPHTGSNVWNFLGLHKALVCVSGHDESSRGPRSWRITESPNAVHKFAHSGGFPLAWLQGMKVIPASELYYHLRGEQQPAGDVPLHVVHEATQARFYVRLPDAATRSEMAALVRLRRWGGALPTWKLAGLVKRDNSGSIMAVLMEPKENTKPLAGIDVASVDRKTREKWGRQVEATMRGMHDIGVVWPHISLEDIEIDEDGDILFTRFAGMKTHAELEVTEKDVENSCLDAVREFKLALGLAPAADIDPAIWADDDDDDMDYNTDDMEEDEDEDEDDDDDGDGDDDDEDSYTNRSSSDEDIMMALNDTCKPCVQCHWALK